MVRPRRNGDLVLAVPIDDDERGPGRHVTDFSHACDVNSLRAKRLQRGAAEFVVAHRSNERNRSAEASRRHGLIRALAALVASERATGHRFAGGRQAVNRYDEIDIDRA
jgi:hypothetical protein